jgi:FtsH-binding integral membrane protein
MRRALLLLSALLAMAPFGAGLIRAVETGSDLRMLWMAVAAFLAGMVISIATRRGRVALGAAPLGAVVFVVTTLAAGTAALLLGATAQAGIWMVAAVYGLCFAGSSVLGSRARAAAT